MDRIEKQIAEVEEVLRMNDWKTYESEPHCWYRNDVRIALDDYCQRFCYRYHRIEFAVGLGFCTLFYGDPPKIQINHKDAGLYMEVNL